MNGKLRGDGLRVAVACARFNDFITERLLTGCRDGLLRHGVDEASVTVAWAPGAFELPLVAQRLAASGDFDAVVCLGAVIRGATGHYEHVAGQCAAGIQRAQLDTGVPVVFGVLTTDTIEQAIERAGHQGRQQGLRGGHDRDRDGRPAAPAPEGRQLTGSTRRPMLKLVLPKGSLERATLELFDEADLGVQRTSDVDVPRHDRRSRASTRCASCARRRSRATSPRACSTRHHRPRLDRGDRQRRRVALSAALLEGHGPARADRLGGARATRASSASRTSSPARASPPSSPS